MSTYTDLHNRVQESINVDYNSRITPQKVKLHNEENEYWGTFHGTVDVTDINVNNGTLSNVTIKNATLDGVTLHDVDGLHVDMDGYATEQDVANAQLTATQAMELAQNANTKATEAILSASTALNGVNQAIQGATAGFDERIGSMQSQINTINGNITDRIPNNIEAAKQECTNYLKSYIDGQDDTIKDKITNVSVLVNERIDHLNDLLDAKDNKVDRESAVTLLCTQLSHSIDMLSHIVDDKEENLLSNDDLVYADLTARVNQERLDRISADDNLSLILSNAISTERNERIAAVNAEQQTRSLADDYLSGAISTEVENRIIADRYLSDAISTEVENRILAISTLNIDISAETQTRIAEDGTLRLSINNEIANRTTADGTICSDMSSISSFLEDKIDLTKAEVLSILEHDRHYIINTDANGYKTTDAYPLIAKDMAVNVYDIKIADGKVIYFDRYDNGVSVEIGECIVYSENPLSIQLRTYANIRNDSIVSVLTENHTYLFTDEFTEHSTGKNYKIKYIRPAIAQSWDNGHFELTPIVTDYRRITYNGVEIGKVYDVSVDTDDMTSILSGKFMFYTPDIELCCFNEFDGYSFQYDTNLSTHFYNGNRVTYLGGPGKDNKFQLMRGIFNTSYISLVDISSGLNTEFGRIYEKIGNDDGVEIVDGQINQIRVDMTWPKPKTVYLNRQNGFCATISTDIQYVDQLYNLYLKADIEGLSASFKCYEASQLYRYEFQHDDLIEDDLEITTSYVTPILYNKTINETTNFQQVKVDLSHVPVLSTFRRDDWILEKGEGVNKWSTSFTDPTTSESINISYTLNKLYINYRTPEDKTVVYHEFNVSLAPDDTPGLGPDIKNEKLTNKYNLETFPNPAELPNATYIAEIDSVSQDQQLATYDLQIDVNDNKIVKIVVPDKITSYGPQQQVSREFMTVLRFNLKSEDESDDFISVNFIDTNGQPVQFYNNRLSVVELEAGIWNTLQVNEINYNKFLVTDLDQNADRLKFAEIFRRLASAETNIDALSDTAIEHQTYLEALSAELSDTMRLKGDVTLRTDYNSPDADPHDEHCHLSMLLSTCIGMNPSSWLERGYMFRCIVNDAAQISNTFFFNEGVEDGRTLSLDPYDCIVLKKDCMLSDTRVSDVEIIKDFSNYIIRLSAASDAKYAMLSGNNKISGKNSISVLSVDVLSAADFTNDVGKISSLSVDALSVGNEVAVDVNISSLTATKISSTDIVADNVSATTAASATSATIVDASISSLSADGISAKTFANLTGNVSSFTAESAYVSAISAADLSVQKVVDVSAYISNLIANDIYADALSGTKISANSLSGTNVSAENLSATELSASSLSTTDLSVSSLSGTNISASNLSATDLSVSNLSGTDISASSLSATNVSAENLSGTNASAEKLTVDYLTGTSACISSLSVNALSDVIDNNTTSSLQDTVNDLDSRINTVSGIVDDALSANCELPPHSMIDHAALSAIVSKLLIVDEVTYDVYALTMRNGALNVDKVGPWPDAHSHPHSK